MAILVYSPDGKYVTKPTLLACATDLDCKGKRVVVTTPLTLAQSTVTSWPDDRTLDFTLGGRLHVDTQVFYGLRHAKPEWFGDCTVDAGPSINKALAMVYRYGAVELTALTYPIKTTVEFPLLSTNIKLFSQVNSTLNVPDGTDIDCINTATANENEGWHVIEGITLNGPNWYYNPDPTPAQYMKANTKAGLLMKRNPIGLGNPPNYNMVLRDVFIHGFKYGVFMENTIGVRFEGKTYIEGNVYGIYINGGQTNANRWFGTMIRHNSAVGIYSTEEIILGVYATNNTFTDCHIESNCPYSLIGANGGVGIYIRRSNDFIFNNCYSENHEYSIILSDDAKGNIFNNHRISAGSAGDDKIAICGANTNNNLFNRCIYSGGANAEHVMVETDNANQTGNQFINCVGINMVVSTPVPGDLPIVHLKSPPYVHNMLPNPGFYATSGHGLITMPPQGYQYTSFEGTTKGLTSGIGTATAKLNTAGCGEIKLDEAFSYLNKTFVVDTVTTDTIICATDIPAELQTSFPLFISGQLRTFTYTGISGDTFTGVTPDPTTGVAVSNGDDISINYRLQFALSAVTADTITCSTSIASLPSSGSLLLESNARPKTKPPTTASQPFRYTGIEGNTFTGVSPSPIPWLTEYDNQVPPQPIGLPIVDGDVYYLTPTTITEFTNLTKHSIFVLWNYQNLVRVTIKSGSNTGLIALKGYSDVSFTDYGQMIAFYVNALGYAYEIGRNFTTGSTGNADGNTLTSSIDIAGIQSESVPKVPIPSVPSNIILFQVPPVTCSVMLKLTFTKTYTNANLGSSFIGEYYYYIARRGTITIDDVETGSDVVLDVLTTMNRNSVTSNVGGQAAASACATTIIRTKSETDLESQEVAITLNGMTSLDGGLTYYGSTIFYTCEILGISNITMSPA
ncbi:MAG: right-handed parallel beta-helix repeat-containing protein [Desulfuromonadaceae bacterium]